MSFVRACSLADIPKTNVIAAVVDGVDVAVVRADGEYYAIEDMCSHAEIPLSEGEVDGTTIECWLHGSRFDLLTGRPTGLPATRPVPIYPVKIDGEEILVDVTSPLEPLA